LSDARRARLFGDGGDADGVVVVVSDARLHRLRLRLVGVVARGR
jgi:hypothetical protein